jgi:hypothetical protein
VVRRSVVGPRRFVSRRSGYWRAPVRRYGWGYRRGPAVRVAVGGPWYGSSYGYWGSPYAYGPGYAYATAPAYYGWGAPYPRRYYRNYWRPGPFVSVGPWGFSFGVGGW